MDARTILGTLPRRGGRVPQEDDTDSPAPPLSAEQVYRDYAPRVYSMARRMVANEADAEDVTQDVLLQVVRKLPSFRGDSAFPTWLHRVTVNAALTHRRRQAAREERGLTRSLDAYRDDETPLSPTHREPAPDDLALGEETRQIIARAVRSLPRMYRGVFVLSDVEGLPNAEIADRLGMSLAAVKSRLHRARAMLRDALTPHFGEVGA
jgi:RNA polymerase sigma-70 factor (ECF subfamily)